MVSSSDKSGFSGQMSINAYGAHYARYRKHSITKLIPLWLDHEKKKNTFKTYENFSSLSNLIEVLRCKSFKWKEI